MNNQNITSEEKLLAMLSHLSILFGGIILPIILWAVQKDKSQFVRFHSLQAIFFHIAYIIIALLIAIFIIFISLASGLGMSALATQNQDPSAMPALFFIIILVSVGLIFLAMFGMIGYGIYLAVKAYGGNYIMIPVIGKAIYRKIFNTL